MSQGRTVEERRTRLEKEVMTWVMRATEEMVQPRDCFVPIKSVYTAKNGDSWVVRAELSENYWNISDVAAGKAVLGHEKSYIFLKTTLALMLAAEQHIGPYSLEPEQLYISASGRARLSPFVSGSERTSGLLILLEVVKSQWEQQDFDSVIKDKLFSIMEVLGDCAENQGMQAAIDYFTKEVERNISKGLQTINTIINNTVLSQFAVHAYMPIIQLVLATFPLTATICMNEGCPRVETGKISLCSQHYYCSEACRKACLQPGKAVCGLCEGYDSCFCGKPLEGKWRLKYMGSDLYKETEKYCSEACLLLKIPSKDFETDLNVSCLACGSIEEDGFAYEMDCKEHGFCSSQCCHNYINEMIPSGFSIGSNCLECSKGLIEFTKKCENYENIKGWIDTIDQLRDVYMRIRDQESFTQLFNAIYVTKEVCLQSPVDPAKLPIALSINTLRHSVYFLTCCACKKAVFVHKRTKAEMLTWRDVPFLIRCDLKLHAVCNRTCLESLQKSSSDHCPTCINSTIDFDTADIPRNRTHPTLEALRRTAGSACTHRGLMYNSLPSCAHEICSDCLNSQLGRSGDSFTCPICLQEASIAEIFALA